MIRSPELPKWSVKLLQEFVHGLSQKYIEFHGWECVPCILILFSENIFSPDGATLKSHSPMGTDLFHFSQIWKADRITLSRYQIIRISMTTLHFVYSSDAKLFTGIQSNYTETWHVV